MEAPSSIKDQCMSAVSSGKARQPFICLVWSTGTKPLTTNGSASTGCVSTVVFTDQWMVWLPGQVLDHLYEHTVLVLTGLFVFHSCIYGYLRVGKPSSIPVLKNPIFFLNSCPLFFSLTYFLSSLNYRFVFNILSIRKIPLSTIPAH